jgi:hypothetical protein
MTAAKRNCQPGTIAKSPPYAPFFFDPLDRDRLRATVDSTLPLLARLELMNSIVDGFCLNAREIMFGVDRRRLAALDMINSTAPPHGVERKMTPAVRSVVSEWIEHPAQASQLSGAGRPGGLLGLSRYVGLGNAAARLQYCRTLRRYPDFSFR